MYSYSGDEERALAKPGRQLNLLDTLHTNSSRGGVQIPPFSDDDTQLPQE